jgi:hypothetical protein
MGPADLQRYHKLLLKKQRELSSALAAITPAITLFPEFLRYMKMRSL